MDAVADYLALNETAEDRQRALRDIQKHPQVSLQNMQVIAAVVGNAGTYHCYNLVGTEVCIRLNGKEAGYLSYKKHDADSFSPGLSVAALKRLGLELKSELVKRSDGNLSFRLAVQADKTYDFANGMDVKDLITDIERRQDAARKTDESIQEAGSKMGKIIGPALNSVGLASGFAQPSLQAK